MRKLLSVLAAAATATTLTSGAVVATSVPPASAATYEGPGSASPEEAVSMYMDGLAGADVDAMVSSFAVETFVDKLRLPRLPRADWRLFGGGVPAVGPGGDTVQSGTRYRAAAR